MQEANIEPPAQTIGVRAVLGATWTLIHRRPLALLAASAGTAAIDSMFDFLTPDVTANLISTVMSIGVVYVVFRLLLRQENLIDTEGGFSSYFGASLLAGIGGLLGGVLLIVPGFYLMARWSLSSAMVVAKGMKATDALRASWQATRGCVWKIVLLYVVFFGAFFGAVTILGATAGLMMVGLGGAAETAADTPIFTILLNFAVNLGVVASAYLSVALFRSVVGGTREVEAVFA